MFDTRKWRVERQLNELEFENGVLGNYFHFSMYLHPGESRSISALFQLRRRGIIPTGKSILCFVYFPTIRNFFLVVDLVENK